MCDAKTEGLILDVVGEMTGRGECFSAFHVTTKLRKDGVPVRHSDVRRVVVDDFESGTMPNYTRQFLEVPGVGRKAYFYFPSLSVPTPTSVTATSNQGASPAFSLHATPPKLACHTVTSVATVNNGRVYEKDDSSRLRIRKRYIQNLGANPGDIVHMYQGSGGKTVILTLNIPSNYKGELMSFIVDKYGNIRISNSSLKRTGVLNAASCKAMRIKADSKRIVLIPE